MSTSQLCMHGWLLHDRCPECAPPVRTRADLLRIEGELLNRIVDLESEREQLRRVTACLLDHYLGCYGDGEYLDRLSEEASKLVPNWEQLKDEWKPKGDK